MTKTEIDQHIKNMTPAQRAEFDATMRSLDEWHADRQLRTACAGTASHHQEETEMDHATPPDPYTEGLQRLRAATAAPAETFEDRYKAERLRELYQTRAALDAEAPRPRMTAAEEAALAAYRAPNPYASVLNWSTR